MRINGKIPLKRLLQVLIPLLLLAAVIMASALIKIDPLGADHDSFYARATVVEVTEDYTGGQPFMGSQKVVARVTSGEYKNFRCELDNPNTYHRGAFCAPGTKIIAHLQRNAEGKLVGSVFNYDRSAMVWLLLILFSVILIAVGGKKGAAALYALVFTFVCVLCVYVPLIYLGMNGVLAAVLTAVLILCTSIYIINGWSVKTLCAVIGTTIGVAISGLLAMVVGNAFHLSGFYTEDVESMLFIANYTPLDVANVLFAGVLISSLGAVMDVSVSVVAAMQELYEKAPRLKAGEQFASGMRVGRDMMGTMSNTLILAYTGSATAQLLTLYSFGMPYLYVMGDNGIIVEILYGLCGTIGVVLTVPVQTAITTLVLKGGKK